MVPMEVVAATRPFASVPRTALVVPVNHTEEVAVNIEVLALVKF